LATRNITNRWTGATGSEFRIKRDPAKLLGCAVARSTQAFDSLCSFMRVLILVVILFATPIAWAQKRPSNPHLSRSQPSVYITFDHQGKIASTSGATEEFVWLRLRNNTRWPIVLDMEGVPSKAYGDAGLFWDVLCEGDSPLFHRCHACSFNSLPPGHYILFTVPREHLAKGCSLRVMFSYAWEHPSGEPEHFVYFYSSDIPSGTR
jgi:hypothetical protein